MRRVCQRLLGFVLIIFLLIQLPAMSHAEPPTDQSSDWWGIVVRDPAYEWNTNPAYPNAANQAFINRMFDEIVAMGGRWVRFEFHGTWDGSSYGAFNLAQADYFVSAAHSRGLKVLALLGTDILRGPQAGVQHFDGGTVSGNIPTSNPDRELNPCPAAPIGCGVNAYQKAWLERAISIADYYRGRIDAYEIFNEPNFYFALRDATNGQQDEMNPYYLAQTITKLYRILRDASRNDQTPLIVGGLHPLTSSESNRTDRNYLQALYQATPFSNWANSHNGKYPIDGVAYHPYPAEMRRLVDDNDFLPLVGPRLDSLVATMRTFDQTSKLWLTEIGTRGDPTNAGELQRQADFMRQFVATIYSRPEIASWFWFKYEDFPPASEAWGVVHINYDSSGAYDLNGAVSLYKPSFYAYRDLVHNFRQRVWIPQALNNVN
ncbi:glycosyl hydrolase [Herpetosiphon llansteffanensis]